MTLANAAGSPESVMTVPDKAICPEAMVPPPISTATNNSK